MRIALAGAFGENHLDGLKAIAGITGYRILGGLEQQLGRAVAA